MHSELIWREEKQGKKSKNSRVKLPHVNKNHNRESDFFVQTVFSLYFEIGVAKFTPQNHSLFRSTSCSGVTKIIA